MWQVYFKELLELVRDKKTLFFVIALPLVVFPVLFGFMALFIVNVTIEEQKKVLKYVIINAEKAPDYNKAMAYHRDFKAVSPQEIHPLLNNFKPEETKSSLIEESIYRAINEQKVDVVIYIPSNYSPELTQSKQSGWTLYFNNAAQINFIEKKINKVFRIYIDKLRTEHLEHLDIAMNTYELLQTPIRLNIENTAKQRENFGEKIGGFIPYILILLCLTGAMYPAIDIGAGEKERGTLETLLLTPISRISLVLGKFFTILTTAITTTLITISSFVFWSYFIGKIVGIREISDIIILVSFIDICFMIGMLLPISAIFSGLVLAISIYAKSYKEAQNYMAPLTMVTFIPVMVAMLPGIKLDSFWAFVPVSNVALAIKEILKGTIDTVTIFYIFSSTAVFAVMALWFCVYCFKKESVLFR